MELTKEEFLRLSMPTSGTPEMDIRPDNTCYYNGIKYSIVVDDVVTLVEVEQMASFNIIAKELKAKQKDRELTEMISSCIKKAFGQYR